MHRFVTEMCTFMLQNGALWDKGQMHTGICERVLLIPIKQNRDKRTSFDSNNNMTCDVDQQALLHPAIFLMHQITFYLHF